MNRDSSASGMACAGTLFQRGGGGGGGGGDDLYLSLSVGIGRQCL